MLLYSCVLLWVLWTPCLSLPPSFAWPVFGSLTWLCHPLHHWQHPKILLMVLTVLKDGEWRGVCRCNGDVVELLEWCCGGISVALWRHICDVVEAYLWCCGGISVVLWRHIGGVVEAYRWCCGGISVVLWRHICDVVEAYRWCCGGISVVLWRHIGGVVEAYRWCCGGISVVLWRHIGGVSRHIGGVVEAYRWCCGGVIFLQSSRCDIMVVEAERCEGM